MAQAVKANQVADVVKAGDTVTFAYHGATRVILVDEVENTFFGGYVVADTGYGSDSDYKRFSYAKVQGNVEVSQ